MDGPHRYLVNVYVRWRTLQKGNCIVASNSEQTVSHAWMMFIWVRFIFWFQ